MELLSCKLVLLGDGKVGKTCLLHSYANGMEYLAKRQDYNRTLLENYEFIIPISESDDDVRVPGSTQVVRLSSWDTAGQEEFDGLRRMCYTGTPLPAEQGSGIVGLPRCDVSVFIVCFAWDDVQSLTNVQMRWYREIRRIEHEVVSNNNGNRHRPFIVVLCGTKFDLLIEAEQRGTTKIGMVTWEQAYAVQQSITADALVICSSKTGFGIRDVFHTAMLLWLQNQTPYLSRPGLNSPSDSMPYCVDDVNNERRPQVAKKRGCHLL